MQIHQLKRIHKNKDRKQVGRGGKRGTYSGKGIKGQNARSGRKKYPAIRELIKKYPKLRGYRFNRAFNDLAVFDVGKLDKNFEDSQIINPEALLKKRLVARIEGETPRIKILGKGELKKKFIIEGCMLSKSAKEAIEKAGGSIK
jgi:large subunit ribosomal protein L15